MDTFRRGPQDELSEQIQIRILNIKLQAENLLALMKESAVEGVPATSRELSIATTKLEEAVMWAVKHQTA